MASYLYVPLCKTAEICFREWRGKQLTKKFGLYASAADKSGKYKIVTESVKALLETDA